MDIIILSPGFSYFCCGHQLNSWPSFESNLCSFPLVVSSSFLFCINICVFIWFSLTCSRFLGSLYCLLSVLKISHLLYFQISSTSFFYNSNNVLNLLWHPPCLMNLFSNSFVLSVLPSGHFFQIMTRFGKEPK
jgi:hypothetical protein